MNDSQRLIMTQILSALKVMEKNKLGKVLLASAESIKYMFDDTVYVITCVEDEEVEEE